MNILFIVVCINIFTKCYSQENQQHNRSYLEEFTFAKNRQINVNPRIIGGQEVTPHSYPFQVALNIHTSSGSYFCGGTLITTEWILTAAHCVDNNPRQIIALLGRHNLSNNESSGQAITVAKYVYHKYWNEKTFQNDIALLKLSRNATLNNYVSTVNIATGRQWFTGQNGTILGWGQTELVARSSVLKSVNGAILSNVYCNTIVPFQNLIVSTHLCVSGLGVIGSCSGDSGGPLIINNTQVGIVSFGYINCNASKPSVFTRLTEYNDWILTNMKGCSSSREICGFLLIVVTCLCLVRIMLFI